MIEKSTCLLFWNKLFPCLQIVIKFVHFKLPYTQTKSTLKIFQVISNSNPHNFQLCPRCSKFRTSLSIDSELYFNQPESVKQFVFTLKNHQTWWESKLNIRQVAFSCIQSKQSSSDMVSLLQSKQLKDCHCNIENSFFKKNNYCWLYMNN